MQRAAGRGRDERRREIGTAPSTTHTPAPPQSQPTSCLPPPLRSTQEGTMSALTVALVCECVCVVCLYPSKLRVTLGGSVCHAQVMHSLTPSPLYISLR